MTRSHHAPTLSFVIFEHNVSLGITLTLLHWGHRIHPVVQFVASMYGQLHFFSGKTLHCLKGDEMLSLPSLSLCSGDGRVSGAGSRNPPQPSVGLLPTLVTCRQLRRSMVQVKTTLFWFGMVVSLQGGPRNTQKWSMALQCCLQLCKVHF